MSVIEQKAREISRPTLEAVGRILARWNVSPDAVTYLGLVLTIGVAILATLGKIRWAGVVYIFAALCDAFDGAVARASGKGSRFGAFLDSTIDRFEESIVFLGLIIYYAQPGTGSGGGWLAVPGWITCAFILVAEAASLMVSYTRARAEAVGVACTVGFMGRPPRVVVMIAGMILDQVLIALIILALTSLFTSFQRMYHVWRMTGGEAGGWGPVKEPFINAAPPVQEAQREDVGESQ
jgi:CDP-diacylglycerol--glycerol-3-phosphate 3-phosphatidyltransferase